MDIKQIKKIARNEAHKVSAIHILILIGIALVAGMMANATTITSNRVTNVTGIPTDVTYLATLNMDTVGSPSCSYTNLAYMTDGNPLTSATFNSSCGNLYINFSKNVAIIGVAVNVTRFGSTNYVGISYNGISYVNAIAQFPYASTNDNSVTYAMREIATSSENLFSKYYRLNNMGSWSSVNEIEFYGIEFDNTI